MPINWDVRAIRGKAKYQDVYLAYLDVLGFKNLVRHAGKSPRYMIKLFERVDNAVHHPRVSGLAQRYLSDSILIWSDHPESLPWIFDLCNELQDELLLEGCLVRGAIVFGQHYSGFFDQLNLVTGERNLKSGEVIISPALIKAFLIESELTDPVIKVEGCVAKAYGALFKGMPRNSRPPKLPISSDRLYDLPSYLLSVRFGPLRAGASNAKPLSADWQRDPGIKKDVAAVRQIRKQILAGVRNSDPRIARKWKYVSKVFNLRVRALEKSWHLMRGMQIREGRILKQALPRRLTSR